MNLSLKSKIIALTFFILSITAVATTYFTWKDVGQAMLATQQKSALNMLRLVELNIKGEYEKIISSRFNVVLKQKKNLSISSDNIINIIRGYYKLQQENKIDEHKAQEQVKNIINNNYFGDNLFAFIFDSNGKIIAHPDQKKIETSIENMKDVKGQKIINIMNHSSHQTGVYSQWQSKDSKGKEFVYLRYFTPWKWTLCCVVNIGDLKEEENKKLQTVLQVLQETFDKITLSKTGFLFLFNSQGKLLVHPPTRYKNYFYAQNTLTGQPIASDLIQHAQKQEASIQIMPDLPNGRLMRTKVFYFKPLGWYVVASIPDQEINAPAQNLVSRQTMLIAIIFFISLGLGLLLAHRITKPLNILSEYAKSLAHTDFSQKASEQTPIDNLPATCKDEVGRLAQTFIEMQSELRTNISNLMEVTAAKERIQGELCVATDIQMGILPTVFPAFPNKNEFELYASLDSAKEVGGDLYNFFFIDDKHLCFAIGDVSDKGVPAALFMAVTMTLIRATAHTEQEVGKIMEVINDNLSRENPNSMFVTLFIGILNIENGNIDFANGGHNPPIIIKNNGTVKYCKGISGPVLGAMEGLPYSPMSMQLEVGESLFLYTDGVTEAMNEKQELYSDERLLTEISLNKEMVPENMVPYIRKSVRAYSGKAPQSDDVTMLMLKFLGKL